jgi:hypothetical protein
VRSFFIPSAALFGEARLATVVTRADLQGHLSTLSADQRLLRLPRVASVELKELVVGAVKQHTSAPNVWAAILGGINENSSTGLRKWCSRHGRGNEAALALESILLAQGNAVGWVLESAAAGFGEAATLQGACLHPA